MQNDGFLIKKRVMVMAIIMVMVMAIMVVMMMVLMLVNHDTEYGGNDGSGVGDYGGCVYDCNEISW